ncbi:MAG: hypothetical protein H0T89_21925 [Deltaproteobacteria bacterium]|nr:hypothetical protein [Deltaproteobacteria bacterium]MDQ3297832.1 hypothetical protein [Myxococcota bacterium]
MRFKVVLMCCALAAVAGGCKKKGGGGGGGWFVGEDGMMMDVSHDGTLGEGYDLGASETLNAIACRYLDEAWVAGSNGTFLQTSDAGESWESHDLGTTADLYAMATQDAGPVYIAGDGVFFTANPDRATGAAQWTQLAEPTTNFRGLSAAQRGTTVLAVSADGGIWSYADGRLERRGTLAGVRAVAVSPDGTYAIAAGDGLARSVDAGLTWTPLAVDAALRFEDVRIDHAGEALAVGTGGTVARIDLDGRVLVQRVGTANLRALHVAPSTTYSGSGFAGGDGGQTWITHDSGWTWIEGPNLGRTVLGVDEIGDGHN